MIADVAHLLELRRNPAAVRRGDRPVSTVAFDWLYIALMLLFNLGVALDIWSHGQFGPDQSVFSEYHMLFYSAIFMMGVLLFGTHQINLRAGYSWANALPVGYGITFLGILLFGMAGVFDLIGHALWGFEVGPEALYSPSHFTLFLSAALLRLGPINAMLARRNQGEKPTLLRMMPGLICLASFVLSMSASALGYAPLGGQPHALQTLRPLDDSQGYTLSVAGSFFQTAVMFGMLLWIIRQMRLPVGSITFIFFYFAVLTLLRTGALTLPVMLIAGGLIELLYHYIQPDGRSRFRMMTFGFVAPLILWFTYYGFIILTNFGGGTYLTPYVWVGSTIQTGLIGAGLAYVMTLKPVTEAQILEGKAA